MKRFWIALLVSPLSALAQNQTAPEPPVESHPLATIVFIVLFVGFCIGFGWMVWRKKEDKKEE